MGAVDKPTVLLVEDDSATADLVRMVLEENYCKVLHAPSVLQARRLIEKNAPDLLILDRHLPDQDGLRFCEELRAKPETQQLAVLFLTSKKSLAEKVAGLRVGDDYLGKPFAVEELIARVEALLRRTLRPVAPTGVLQVGPLKLHVHNRQAWAKDAEVSLTKLEFDLLRAFLERPQRVLTRVFLLAHVWGYDEEARLNTKAVDVAILGLRRKLGRCGDLIESVRGYGYRLASGI